MSLVDRTIDSLDPDRKTAKLPVSSKEKVLGNYDLLSNIINRIFPLEGHDGRGRPRQGLLDLALVCSAFREPALDCLWSCLTSFIPLIKLLPSMQKVNGAYCVHDLHDLGDPFSKCSKRVRRIDISKAIVPLSAPIDPIVYVLLSQRLNGAPLLPSLECMVLSSAPEHFSWQLLPLLIPSPSFRSIELKGTALDTTGFHQLGLPLLASRASSSLTSLLIINEEAIVEPVLWEIVPSFRCLERLSLCLPVSSNIPGDFVFQLGRNLDRLSELTLDVHFPDHIIPTPSKPTNHKTSAGSIFRNLESLTLVNRAGDRVCQCFSPVIEKVTTATLLTSAVGHRFKEMATDLAKCPSLTRIELKYPSSQWEDSQWEHLLYFNHHIGPFLERLNLTEFVTSNFTVTGGPRPSGDSASVCFNGILQSVEGRRDQYHDDEGRESPPRRPLRTLILPKTWKHGNLALTGLEDVARRVPELRHLGIGIDSSTGAPSAQSFNLDSQCSEMLYLEINDTRSRYKPFTSKECRAIARYLDYCFPNLVSVTFSFPHSNELFADSWGLIEHLRKSYKAIRVR